MTIEIVLTLFGSDFYPVEREKYLYEDLSKEFELPVATLKAIPNEKGGTCRVICGSKEVELPKGEERYIRVPGNEDYEIKLTLR